MFRNALAAALRHLGRDRWYAAIAVFGLAVGLCAALLAALYVRSEYSYEHFVPGYKDVYQVTEVSSYPDSPRSFSASTPQNLASLMRHGIPGVASVSRMAREGVLLRLGDIELDGSTNFNVLSSVDPDFFDTLPLAVVAGDPAAAVAEPDKLVITRKVARHFFGEDAPLGRTLEVVLPDDGIQAITQGSSTHTVTVGAVVEDIAPNRSRLVSGGAFVSGRSAWTQLGFWDQPQPDFPSEGLGESVITLVRLQPAAPVHRVREALPGLLAQIPRFVPVGAPEEALRKAEPDLLRIDRVHTNPDYNPGIASRMLMVATLALVILVIAAVNFVNLLTARSGARTLEVGVRKIAGASRAALAWQFLGEAFAYVTVAVVVAVALTELLLPRVNAYLGANADFQYWKEPALLGWMLVGTVLFSLLAGFWPALVLSALRPLGAMQGARMARGDGGLVRRLMVSLQFALLAGLVLAAGVVYLQRHFATSQAMRFDTEQVLILETDCTPARVAELHHLAGVRDAACSTRQLLGGGADHALDAETGDGRQVQVLPVQIDDRMLAMYGVEPLAGRGLAPGDFDLAARFRYSRRYLINESAMRAFGFGSPAAALGPFPLSSSRIGTVRRNGQPGQLEEIIGVLPDFSMVGVDAPIGPQVFFADPMQFSTISVKLAGTDLPATLAAIDQVWKNTGGGRFTGHGARRLNRYFYDERVERMYQSMLREARTFAVMSLVAVSLALLGLLGLAASAAERRTKEIGIRKALGADTGDVLRLLLWQFSKPVVWANLVVWPLAAWFMQRWLNGFAYHVDLPLWLFPATTLATVLIALATVSVHTAKVARAKPVAALRYE